MHGNSVAPGNTNILHVLSLLKVLDKEKKLIYFLLSPCIDSSKQGQ